MSSVTAFAPATVANVSCGFDILGFAVEHVGDKVSVEFSDQPGVSIKNIEGDLGKLPLDPKRNVCSVSVLAMLKSLDKSENIAITIDKGLPLGSGLGSSSASTVAALVAANGLLGNPYTRKELLPFALEGERAACGNAHADNVAPCLLGGLVLIRDYVTNDLINLPVPTSLKVTLIHPHFELNTSDSRRVLKKNITLEESKIQTGNIAGFITSLFTNDYELMKRSMRDVIAEPARSVLIPEFFTVREAILDIGAIGSGISGSGPTIFIFSSDEETALAAEKKCLEIYRNIGLEVDSYISSINLEGAKVL